MPSGDDRLRSFEARLAELKHRMESGLVDRARALRDLAGRVENGDEEARRALKSEGHKLRGIAGSYGHTALGELAGRLEQRASVSPPASVGELARELADAAERTGRTSLRPPPAPPVEPPSMSAHQRTVSERPRITADDGKPLRVLAMDDDPVTLKLLTLTLRDVGGFEAVILDSAVKALEQLKAEPFDVVVSDAMMPDMDGRAFCEQARKLGRRIPIIILSAAARDELAWDPTPDGPDAWLRKPFSPSSLVHDIARIVEDHREE